MKINENALYKKISMPIILGFCFKKFDKELSEFVNTTIESIKNEASKDSILSSIELGVLKYEFELKKVDPTDTVNFKVLKNFNFDFLIQEKEFKKINTTLAELFNNARKLFYRRQKTNTRRGTKQLKPTLILFVDKVNFNDNDKNIKQILSRRSKNKYRYKLYVFVKGKLDKRSLLTNYRNINLYDWGSKAPQQILEIIRQEANI